ncbi:hypothetical protein AAZX31_08G230500 [Glycine max]
MVDLNWLFVLLGFGVKGAPNMSDDNTKAWNQILLLTIVLAIWWLLCHLAEDRETNPIDNEVDDELGEILEHPNGELDHYFDEDGHHRAAEPGGDANGRHGGCSICGNFSTTRCASCKAARYSKCQIIHWRSGHKYECSESEITADEARPTHDHGTSKLVEKSEMWNPKSNVGVEVSSGNDVNTFHGCEICSSPSTTRCSRCKSVKYCLVKCLIMDWKWHKDHCIARVVDSTPIERPCRDVGLLKNSYEEEENIPSSGPLSLVFHPEGTTSFNSLVPVSHSKGSTNNVLYLEDEVAKSRNEILLLQSELNEWKNRANFAREKFQSLKRESNYQESIAEAETRACNVIHSLHERLTHLQNVVQENIAEKRKLEEDLQNLESECSDLKKQLQEEHKCAQRLTIEFDKRREAAQIAMREVEAVRQVLQEEREHTQRVKENFRRDVIFVEARATFAEEKLSDLYRKIRMSYYKVCSICLSNEKDLVFGCGHMTCRDCGSKLSKCPICREQITNHIKLFPG